MRVSDVADVREGGVRRVTARLTWEDAERPDQRLWFEWPDSGASEDALPSSTLLLATYPLAMLHGERRVHLEFDVCPRLADGARAAMGLLAEWHPKLRPVVLDVHERLAGVLGDSHRERAAICLSGGVDALTALLLNRRDVPAEHPAYYRDALFAFGLNSFDFADGRARPDRLRAYEEQHARLGQLCTASSLALHRVSTNLRALYPNFEAYGAVAHGSPLAAIGHGMPQLRSLAMANAGAGVEVGITPHPLLDAFYASHDLEVFATQIMLPRLEKVRLLAEWPEGLAALRVCFMIDVPPAGSANCGQCEKCVRTMLEFLAVGALDRAPFPAAELTADAIATVSFDSLAARIFYREVAPALAARGRDDLANAINRSLAKWEARRTPSVPWWRRARR